MKGYVITVSDISESVAAGERCIQSGSRHGVDVRAFEATNRSSIQADMESLGLFAADFKTNFADYRGVVACFVSHFRVWQQIHMSSKPGIVLEHDAVFVAQLPSLEGRGDIVNLGKPSYGRFKRKWRKGLYPFFSKKSMRLGGAHAYYVTPSGAEALMATARAVGAMPPDLFISVDRFPGLAEVYPWPVIAQDDFTTIQLAAGCKPKHGHSEKYRILTGRDGQ
jgi:GR25 family glycosyltransferase involved in LPS biosynthesis